MHLQLAQANYSTGLLHKGQKSFFLHRASGVSVSLILVSDPLSCLTLQVEGSCNLHHIPCEDIDKPESCRYETVYISSSGALEISTFVHMTYFLAQVSVS